MFENNKELKFLISMIPTAELADLIADKVVEKINAANKAQNDEKLLSPAETRQLF